ncbi:YcjX family protein [Paracraurococcus lichenis]|uniref:YcjX family protein n=1 Tax=Paracraurococcus lichenis TaxID=3064888 RepID=A0ABT9DVM8_9PROT|nr:YcjX family protein [Paracraurococcus sp. LOR1-02]MDO9707954.1 YcjX family protein [Paracraurococcus sp. LOR1-02]
MSGLVDPFGLLRDAAYGAERFGRSLIGQERIRLAVTGLTRAGKTVFLTSLLANLLAAGRGRRTLPALEQVAGGRLRAVRPVPPALGGLPRFDVEGHLAALAANPPAWPARTEDLSTLELVLELDRQSLFAGLLGTRTVTLELLDYPGEWLLDLPMLRQDFSAWSEMTLARMRRGARAEVSAEFLAFLDGLPAYAAAEPALVRRGAALYRDSLRACRDRLGFRFLQPGRLLNPGPRGETRAMQFFPVPATLQGELADRMAERHAAYVEAQRNEFFEPYFRRFERQAVLVDVLGALHAGRDAFEDTADALAAIAEALRYGGGWLDWLTGVGVDRVAFVATKADHVPARQRDALAALLGHLVKQPQGRVDSAGVTTSVHALASIRCTEDDVATLDGRPVAAVRGVLLANRRAAKVYPGEIPLRPPEPGFWEHGFFEMPEFQPPRLDPAGGAGVPHLELDALVAALIGDVL